MIGVDGSLQFFELTLHVFNLDFLVFQAFIFAQNAIVALYVFTVFSQHKRLFFGDIQNLDKLLDGLFSFTHFSDHQ